MRKHYLFITLLLLLLLSMSLVAWSQERRKHIVKPQETAYRIARKYQVSLAELYKLNPGSEEKIVPGQVLIIPSSSAVQNRGRAEDSYHAVEASETLYSISRSYGLSVEQLRAANPAVQEDRIAVGMILKIPPSATAARSAQRPQRPPQKTTDGRRTTPHTAAPKGLKIYKVQRGQTIYNLLNLTGWSQEELLRYNPLLKDGLKTGQSILIPDETLPSLPASVGATEKQHPFVMPSLSSGRLDVVLALPFREDDKKKYTEYYEGSLLAIKEAKDAGMNIHLTVVDCSDAELSKAIESIRNLSSADLIIGGSSDQSIQQLSKVAERKQAKLVIPFSSKPYRLSNDYGVYFVNTPHEEVYRILVDRFMQEYSKKTIVLFDSYLPANDNRGSLLQMIKKAARAHGTPVVDLSLSTPLKGIELLELQKEHGQLVVMPNTSSLEVAHELLDATIEARALGGSVEIFAYPEWQVYEPALRHKLAQTHTTFYSMFYIERNSSEYNRLHKAFLSWYGHAPANIYPKYGILGYDITRYFLRYTKPGPQPKYMGELPRMEGIQSKPSFSAAAFSLNTYVNNGLIFVSYRNGNQYVN